MCFGKEVRTGWASYLLPDVKSTLTPGLLFRAIGTQIPHVASHCSLREREQPSGHGFLPGLPVIPPHSTSPAWLLSFGCPCQPSFIWKESHPLEFRELSQSLLGLVLLVLPRYCLWHSHLQTQPCLPWVSPKWGRLSLMGEWTLKWVLHF